MRWVASAVTGEVATAAPGRGLLDPRHPGPQPHLPPRPPLDGTGRDAAFGPTDRIGQLTMRNLDIADSRAKIELYAAQGQLLTSQRELVGEVESGRAAEIAAIGAPEDDDATDVESLDRAAIDSGVD